MGILAGIDTYTGWTLLQSNGAAIEKAYAESSGTVDSAITNFESIAPKLTSAESVLNNYSALTFVTTAFGLQSEIDQTAILKDLMTQDPNKSGSLAQQLADNRYRNFAGAMSNWDPSPFSTSTEMDTLVSDYKEQSYESEIGQDNGTLQEALYFQNNAVGATTITQLMSDPALLNVVEVAEGIPTTAFGQLDYNQQLSILSNKVDMSQFATKKGVDDFIQKYLAMNEVNTIESGGTSSDPIVSLFSSATGSNDSASIISNLATIAAGLDIKI